MKILTIAALVFLSSFIGLHAGEIRLIVRGDDLGMTEGSLVAFERALNRGILTCASLIVCAPWFEAAAELTGKNPRWCIGIHLALVGEWRGYRWRPVLPWDQVPSLVDEDGFLYGDPGQLLAKRPSIEEVEAELRAQVRLALKKGVKVQYLDMHYLGPREYPGLDEVVTRIAKDYDLPISGRMGERPVRGVYKVPVAEKQTKATAMLKELPPGLWLWVSHPGIDSPEQEALVHSAEKDVFKNGGVGPHRAEETNVLTSPEVRSVIQERKIQLTDYCQLWIENRQKQ